MKVSGMVKKIVEMECMFLGSELAKIDLTPKQANVLTEKICCAFGIRPAPVVIINEHLFDKRGNQIFAQCVNYKKFRIKKIVLYRDGNNVEALTHEIAHLQRFDHSVHFHQVWLDMMKWFYNQVIDEYVKPIKKPKTKKERKPTMKKIFKNIIAELECEAVNKTLKMKVIGIALLEVKMNNMENITMIKKELIKRGYNIV